MYNLRLFHTFGEHLDTSKRTPVWTCTIFTPLVHTKGLRMWFGKWERREETKEKGDGKNSNKDCVFGVVWCGVVCGVVWCRLVREG